MTFFSYAYINDLPALENSVYLQPQRTSLQLSWLKPVLALLAGQLPAWLGWPRGHTDPLFSTQDEGSFEAV